MKMEIFDRIKNIGIRGRFIIITSVVITIIMMAMAFLIVTNVNKGQNDRLNDIIEIFTDQNYDREILLKNNLKLKGKAIMSLMANSSTALIVGFDFDSLGKLISDGMKDKEIFFIQIKDKDNNLLTNKFESNKEFEKIQQDINLEGEKIGSIEIFLDYSKLKQELSDAKETTDLIIQDLKENNTTSLIKLKKIIGISILSAIFILVLIIFIVLQKYVVSPISLISKHLNTTSNELEEHSTTLSDHSQKISNSAEQQAATLENTASTMEEIVSTVKQTADNSGQANDYSNKAIKEAVNGSEISTKLEDAMIKISESSNKIFSIVNLVNEIAFQTNILAINAAIEAAKAGDHGKGFAIVAIEVRELAQKVSLAAKDIKMLIQESIEKVKIGTDLCSSNSQELVKIKDNIQNVSDIMTEISSATQEQHTALNEVNSTVMELDSTAQTNSNLANQSLHASSEINKESEGLNNLLEQLKHIIG